MADVRILILPSLYRDSAFLMKLSSQAREMSGAVQISAMMATPRNKDLLMGSGLPADAIESARPQDLVVAIEPGPAGWEAAENAVRELLRSSPALPASGRFRVRSLLQATRSQPGSNLAIISVAGDYARYEAAEALSAGLDVMLYSDGIGVADELALKQLAKRKNLILMGPECGTASVDGVPLGFANRLLRGPIGLVASSGTGIQETSCLLDRVGIGVSCAFGTGRRDFTDAIGGLTAGTALRRLAEDPGTALIIVIAHHPGPETRRRLTDLYRKLGKPVFVRYLGVDDHGIEDEAGIPHAGDLRELALGAIAVIAPRLDLSDIDLPAAPAGPVSSRRGLVRGIFSGGTLCHEAAEQALALLGGNVQANLFIKGVEHLDGVAPARGHAFIDMGAEAFTVGSPHPILFPEAKLARITAELCDPEVAVVLTDIILGCGTAEHQAALLVRAVDKAARLSGGGSRRKTLAISVCGTERDQSGRSAEIDVLRRSSLTVLGNNVMAARWAVRMATEGGDA